MADTAKVVEGKIKFREGKKWKSRWCVLKKPSPVADRLQVSLFKDVVEVLRQDAKPKSVFALEGFLGLDAGFRHDREAHVMAIICQKNVHLMAFEIRENMIQFEIKIRQSLGEEHQFPVRVVKSPSNSRLPKDNLRLFIHDSRFCLLAFSPPKVFLSWNVEDLRRFGARDGKFCYEGGTRCGKGSGVFALESEQAEDIADIINLASTGKMSNCHRKFKNRRRLSTSSSEGVIDQINCTKLTIPISFVLGEASPSGVSSDNAQFPPPTPSSPWLQCHQSFSTVDTSMGVSECTSPAKSVLRPRSGTEYVVISRKTVPSVRSRPRSIASPTRRQVFSFDLSPSEVVSHTRLSHHRRSSPHSPPTHSVHSLSHGSRSPSRTPQPSPSQSSTADTTQSNMSLHGGDMWEREPFRCALLRRGVSLDRPAPASPSPASSPCPVLSHSSISSAHSKETHKKSTLGSPLMEENVFFPIDLSFSASSPPSSCSPSPLPSRQTPSVHEVYPTYVNQEFIMSLVNSSTNGNSRTVSSSSSQSSATPLRAGMQSLMSLFSRESSRHSPSESNSLGRSKRSRSRHSESDANRPEKHSLSLSSNKSSHSSTLPLTTQYPRPKSGEKAEKPLSPLSLPPEDYLSNYQCKVHQKEYDKFAHSSIISRRRAQTKNNSSNHSQSRSGDNIACGLSNDGSVVAASLLVTPIKSSGYKNIDSFNFAAAMASSQHLSGTGVGVAVDTESHSLPVEVGSQERSLASTERSLSKHRALNMDSSPGAEPRGVSPVSSTAHPQPPLLGRRLPSSPMSSSPPLSPNLTLSDTSDSPPSYYAPSPPSTPPPPPLPARKPVLPLPSPAPPSTPSEPELGSDYSDTEAELNYIEVDMTKSPQERRPQPCPIAYTRRSKRVKTKREEELRYAVIDLRATQALQQTRQEHVHARDSGVRKPSISLSRINSAPASSKRKPLSLVPRERKLSSGSVDSC
ncbi:serine/arginine repetitive matrix protein 1 [Aplysia californica]|uniref:Serine/arginine repetitive matrix protein 1 n=1 Tax=Aplysia californica TaxID=6500 RepID=A0ABM0JS66_APLCA|nr:serine/arginine repetitive matrix protein 1 [Aplysia californica]